MEGNYMRKSGRERPSGKRGKAAALCALGMAACILCALCLPGLTAAREPFAPERAETDGPCVWDGGGFVTTVRVEKMGGAGTGRETAAKAARLSNSVPEPTQEPEVELHAEEVTQGEYYDTLIDQVSADETSLIAPAHVMELTASLGGKKLDLSGCEITLQVDPAPALVKTAMEEGVAAAGLEEDGGGTGKQPGMIVTVQPLGGEAVTRIFTGEELESGRLSPVDVTYTVPMGAPAMYAVSARAIDENTTVLNSEETWMKQRVIAEDTTIDLNGHTLTCGNPLKCQVNPDDPDGGEYGDYLFVVRPGATLTIMDSKGTSSIEESYCPLVYISDGGTLNIQGGTLDGKQKNYVILADGNSTVNMSGGMITGGTNWAGAGIFVADNGTVNISGGEITGNYARNGAGGLGAGIYAVSGTVNISGNAKITGNDSDGFGGGIYAVNGTVNISGGEIKENTAGSHGGGIYTESGTVNISETGKITNNTAAYFGGGVCCGVRWGNALPNGGKVVMTKGEISGNKATTGSTLGGGVCAKELELSGGTISTNTSNYQGGGVWAETVTMSGGTISTNTARNGTDEASWNSMNSDGGGIWATRMDLSGGTITENHAQLRGGGVYTTSMVMTGGTVSNNTVIGYTMSGDTVNAKAGGGGIFLAKGAENYIFQQTIVENGEEVTVRFNMSITGGTISGNKSNHAGGGIFVDKGAVAHIRGEKGKVVSIRGNFAYDVNYNSNQGQGYAGGGIFVEHDTPNSEYTDADRGGQLYLYDALITNNTAQHGGGIAGCRNSTITVGSVSGVAVYSNHATGGEDSKVGEVAPISKDLYADGGGTVESMMLGDVTTTWEGKVNGNFVNGSLQLHTLKSISFASGVKSFENFYLTAGTPTDQEQAAIRSKATTVIEGNTSGSGGGGVGGNGYMKLGLVPPTFETLTLRKIVSGPNTEEKFKFTITLLQNKKPLEGSYSYIEHVDDKEVKKPLVLDKNGQFTVYLKGGEYISIEGLVGGENISYTITEDPAAGYTTSITVDGNTVDGASGEIQDEGTTVVFTNTANPYALPETGGVSPAVYIGGALLLVAAGTLIYRKRARKGNGCQ